MRPCNLHIARTLQLVDEMIDLADQGDSDREDNGCGILYGVLRDSAFKLKQLAEAEKREPRPQRMVAAGARLNSTITHQ